MNYTNIIADDKWNLPDLCPLTVLGSNSNSSTTFDFEDDGYDYELANVNSIMVDLFEILLYQYYENATTSLPPLVQEIFNQTNNRIEQINNGSEWRPSTTNVHQLLQEMRFQQQHGFLNSFKEQFANLNPRNDPELYRKQVFENLLTISSYLLLIIVSLFGNLLVLFIILSRRHLHTQMTNKLIANLTVSDLILTIFNIPLTIVRILSESWPLGSIICQLGPWVQALSVYVSTISMVVIAIDRHQVLLGTLPNTLSSTLPSMWTIAAIWMLSAVFSIPYFIFNRVVYKQTYTCIKRCQAVYPKPSIAYSRAVTIFTFLSQYLVPLTIITICYSQIMLKVWKRVRIGAMTRSQETTHLQSKKRTIKMLVLVVIVFAICWAPLNMFHIYLDFVPGSIYSKPVFTFSHWFGLSSVCYNPFIYFWLNKQYKERAHAILAMCFKWHCCQPTAASVASESPQMETCSSYDNINLPTRCYKHFHKQTIVMKVLTNKSQEHKQNTNNQKRVSSTGKFNDDL